MNFPASPIHRFWMKMRERYPIFLVGLSFIAMLINLGEHHLFVHTDEPRRTVVTLEMMLSGNFWVPTIHGEYYFNKPPLFNWLLAGVFFLYGEVSAYAQRLPTVVSAITLALLIYAFSQRYQRNVLASWLAALFFLSNARVFFYDSFLGMIDIPFAIIAFVQFMAFYEFSQSKRWRSMFLVSYALAALGFLTKGLPAVAFQGMTLMALAVFIRQWRFIFSRDHILGGLLFSLLVGTYYSIYFQMADVPFEILAQTIFEESSKRTILRFGIWTTIIHVLYFPLDTIANFSPWSWIAILFFHRDIRQQILANPFHRFCIFAFFANIMVYWTSPEVAPRYLLMLFALISPVLASTLLVGMTKLNMRLVRGLHAVFLYLGLLLTFAIIAIPYWEKGRNAPDWLSYEPMIFGLPAIGITLFMFYANPLRRVWLLILLLIVCRMSYSSFLLPQRAYHRDNLRLEALEVARLSSGKDLFVFGNTELHDGSIYYIANQRQEILRIRQDFNQSAFYLVHDAYMSKLPFESQFQMRTLYVNDPIHLVWVDSQTKVTVP